MIRRCALALFAIFLIGCNGGGDNSNNGTNNSGNGCMTTGDCPSDDSVTFADESRLECETDVNGRGYCSECLLDRDCGEGNDCIDRTYCEELAPCTTSRDCADEGELVHFACINGGCGNCADHPDCDETGGEMCYNRSCVPRANVAQECIDATCPDEAACITTTDDAGNPTGFACP